MASKIFVCAFAACVLALVAGNALPLNFNQLPEQFKGFFLSIIIFIFLEFVPDEVKDFYAELTEEDKTVLKDLAGKHAEFANEDEALNALKEKSPKLHEKAVALRTLVQERIAKLQPEAKKFIVEKLKSLKPKGDEKPNLNKLRETANEVIDQYKALSEEAKTDLQTQFPKITSVVKNEKFQKLAQGLLKTEPAAA